MASFVPILDYFCEMRPRFRGEEQEERVGTKMRDGENALITDISQPALPSLEESWSPSTPGWSIYYRR